MARKTTNDDRQNDFFGGPVPPPPAPKPAIAKPSKPPPKPEIVINPDDNREPPHTEAVIEQDSLDTQLGRLSSAELRGLAGTLSDESLAQFTLATIRELQRRLARNRQPENSQRQSVLERAAQQLIAELSEPGDDFYDFDPG